MTKNLIPKCENLMLFLQSNLYIHSKEQNETIQFSKLTIPSFLQAYNNTAVTHLLNRSENSQSDLTSSQDVNLYIDPFKLSYLTWPVIQQEKLQSTITLGPLLSEHLTKDEIRYIGYKMKLSSDNMFILESFYGNVPYFDKIQIARIASFFLEYLAVEHALPRIIRDDDSIEFLRDEKLLETTFQHFDLYERNRNQEIQMLEAIERGDVSSILDKINTSTVFLEIPIRYPSDPLREKKNLAITTNSLAMRAAEKGGIDSAIAHDLSHNFAITIESQTTPEAIGELIRTIIETYAQSVRDYGLKDHTETIIHAVTYIRANLTEKIRLHDIASVLHLSPEHLSRKFKEEMSVTISDYIHKLKISESCRLLASKKYTISEISYMFSYSSPAHYSRIFKKFMGTYPRQWQASN